MKKEPKDVREVKIIATSFKRSLARKDAEEERLEKEIEKEYSGISKNPLEVAEFTALYVLLIISPFIILFINYMNKVNPEAADVRNYLFKVSFGFFLFGLMMFFAAPEGLRGVLKDLVRLRGEISERSKRYLMLTKHSEYGIFRAAFLFLLFFSLQYWLTGYMWDWVALLFTILIMWLLWKYFGCYLRPLYRMIDALPLNLQLFYISLVVLLVLLPNYAGEILNAGSGSLMRDIIIELFFLSLFMECVGVAMELVLFLGIRYGLGGTFSSFLILLVTYMISTSVSSFMGLGVAGGIWYAPTYIGTGILSFFLGFYREDKRIYEWYAAAICIISSIILVTSREIQYASILLMIALFAILTVYDAKRSGRLTLQPSR